MRGIIDVNGVTTPLSQANIPVIDRGFLYGESVFETLVAFSGQLIHATEHINRLYYSAACLNLTIPWQKKELLQHLQKLAKTHVYDKAYIRLVITGGNGFSLSPARQPHPNKIIYILPAPAQKKEPISLQLSQHPYTIRKALPKTSNYLPSILALKAAHKNGFDDILWLNSQNEITETSTANLFFIKKGTQTLEVLTPCIKCGIIDGTVRKAIIDLMKKHLILVQEKKLFEKYKNSN